MKKHTPALVTFALSLVGATTLMSQAPTDDIDAVTATPPVRLQVHATPATPAPLLLSQAEWTAGMAQR